MASKSERRDELVRAAIDVIAEKGLGGTRVADIAERAGISPGHVLYYFDGKADIFTRALRTVEDDLRREAHAAFEERPSAADRWDWLVRQAAPTGAGDPRVLLWIQAWERAPRDPTSRSLSWSSTGTGSGC
jgi:AcrR family transcriptional regulator